MADHSLESLAAAIGGYGAEALADDVASRKQDQLVQGWKSVLLEPVRAGNRVEAFVDGTSTLRSMYDALRSTLEGDAKQHYIYLLAWSLHEDVRLKKDDPDSTFLSLVSRAAQAGVQVRIMVWKVSHRLKVPRHQHEKLAALGPNVALVLDDHLVSFYQTHHQKVLVVKGSQGLVGFCGGVDIAKDRVMTLPKKPFTPLHDAHCRIEGPAAHDLVDVFVQRWQAHPDHARIDSEKGVLRGLPDRVPPANAKPRGDRYVAIRRTYVRPDPKSEGDGCAEELSIASSLLGAIRSARQFIYIEDQYLVGFEIANALSEALKIVKHVTILIPHSAITDLPNKWEGRWEFLRRISEKNPDTYRRKLRTFFKYVPAQGREKPPGSVLTPDDFGPRSYVHAKVWIVDDELAVIGSANCNRRGWTYDSEANAFIFDRPPSYTGGATSFAHALRMRLWAQHLHLSEDAVRDPIRAANLWVTPEAGSHVRPYNPFEQSDQDTDPRKRAFFGSIRPNPRRPNDGFDDLLGPTDPQHRWNVYLDPSPQKLDHCRR